MSEADTITSLKVIEPPTQSAANPETEKEAPGLRKSERSRTLTEKGKEMQEETIKRVRRRYKIIYEKWKYHARIGKEILADEASKSELKELIGNMESACSDMTTIYDELRRLQVPEADLRRRVDTCVSLSAFMIKRANEQLKGHTSDQSIEPWPDVVSILDSASSSLRSPSHKCGSVHSSIQSLKRKEAEAEAAASKEVLAVLDEQEKEVTELQRLEIEEKQRLAQFEAESLARQQVIQEKHRKLARLEEMKKLNAAKARVKIYEEVNKNLAVISSRLGAEPVVELEPPSAPILPVTTQNLYASNSPVNPQPIPIKNQPLSATSPPFIPQSFTTTNQTPPASPFIPQAQNSSDLINALAEAINANRLPTPEPAIYTGDPLKFKDWCLSFETLIDRKNIPKNEKLYYLRKYLGGAAKKAVEGHFLLGTEEAYDSAWHLLEKCFGDPYIIGKSFRDKLNGWPKVSSKDGAELREFADFLKSCEAAMQHIKTLDVLNDSSESQKILLKLPDWLVSSWNRKAMEVRQTRAVYPSFKELVDFLSREADLACDSITSIQALKAVDSDKPRNPRSQPFQAKTLSTNTTQNSVPSCVFCKKTGHGLAKCIKFNERTVQDRVKFAQAEKLCFGCLKTGHHSRRCEKKSTHKRREVSKETPNMFTR